jgi:hypothetical protein
MVILRHSYSPVEDGILHNTPPLQYSSTPFKNHATAEPSLSDPRKAGSSTVPEDQGLNLNKVSIPPHPEITGTYGSFLFARKSAG